MLLCSNKPSLCRYQFNNIVSGIKLGQFTTAKLYDKSFYRGKRVKIKHNISCLEVSNGFNDKTTSIKIFKSQKPRIKPPAIKLNRISGVFRHKGKKVVSLLFLKFTARRQNKVWKANFRKGYYFFKGLRTGRYLLSFSALGWKSFKLWRNISTHHKWNFTIKRKLVKKGRKRLYRDTGVIKNIKTKKTIKFFRGKIRLFAKKNWRRKR